MGREGGYIEVYEQGLGNIRISYLPEQGGDGNA